MLNVIKANARVGIPTICLRVIHHQRCVLGTVCMKPVCVCVCVFVWTCVCGVVCVVCVLEVCCVWWGVVCLWCVCVFVCVCVCTCVCVCVCVCVSCRRRDSCSFSLTCPRVSVRVCTLHGGVRTLS